MNGIVNVAAPNPLQNAEFMRLLREACGVSFGLPARAWMLEIGAVFMRRRAGPVPRVEGDARPQAATSDVMRYVCERAGCVTVQRRLHIRGSRIVAADATCACV
jgi:hypothetical protein